jgi:hypothetical protein
MELRKTITSIFIVPTLKINRDKLKDNGYLNGYLSDDRRDVQYKNAVYLLFKPDNLDKFREFLDSEAIRTKSLLDDYDYEDGFVVVVYKLDNKWKADFILIKQGKYSKTSKEFQELFPKVLKILKNGLHKDQVALQHKIFRKAEDLRQYWEDRLGIEFDDEMEVWDGFEIENETLNLTTIKQQELI